MAILNNKIFFELLHEDDQPKKTIFTPNADLLKHARVIEVGHQVERPKESDIITLPVTTMIMTEKSKGFCSERDVIFVNGIPSEGKIHINKQSKEGITLLLNANVISSNSSDVQKGDTIFYREGQSMQLPDNTEIISEKSVYYKK
jgi:hypothetical protein